VLLGNLLGHSLHPSLRHYLRLSYAFSNKFFKKKMLSALTRTPVPRAFSMLSSSRCCRAVGCLLSALHSMPMKCPL
jgi:hypothetical protein